MDLGSWTALLRRRWRLLVLGGLLGAVSALTWSSTIPNTYQATTSVFFAPARAETVSELNQGSLYTQGLMQSFAEVVTEPAVLEPVIRSLGLQVTPRELAQRITAETALDTVVMTIGVTSEDPRQAAAIANAVGRQLRTTASQLTPAGAEEGRAITVTTVAPAQVPRSPVGPARTRNTLLGLALGVAAASAAALLRQLLDRRVQTEEQVARLSGLPVLTTIPLSARAGEVPTDELDDAYRRLRTNLGLQVPGEGSTCVSLVVTSAVRREGRTSAAVDLALALSETGARTLLVDADLHQPMVATHFGVEDSPGLCDVLLRRISLQAAVQGVEGATLHLLAAGDDRDRGSALLGAPPMREALAEAQRTYDAIVLDVPPVLTAADALILGQQVTGVLLVVDAQRLKDDDFRACLDEVQRARVAVLGVVLNKAHRPGARRRTSMTRPTGRWPRPDDQSERARSGSAVL